MKLTYTSVNGYLIPNLTYKSGEQMEQLGKYGFLRRDYLKNHRNSLYQVMLLQDSISEHLLEVDKAAREREEIILKMCIRDRSYIYFCQSCLWTCKSKRSEGGRRKCDRSDRRRFFKRRRSTGGN